MRLVAAGLILVLAFIAYQYINIPLPHDMDEKWKLRIIDAILRMSGHMGKIMSAVGMTNLFTNLDRKIADICVTTISTGRPWGAPRDPALKVEDLLTEKNKIHLRVYEPRSTLHQDNRPVLLYFHGGGWSVLSVDAYDALTRKLARDSGIVVISVNYRLSPEFPYPIPLDDCMEAFYYIRENAAKFRINPDRMAVGGDSAGGNLAASLSLRLREKIKLQLLLVPVLHLFSYNTTSVIENKKYFASTTNNMNQVAFWLNYLNESYTHIPTMLNNQHTSAELKCSVFADYIDQNKWMNKQYIRSDGLKSYSLEQKKNYGRSDMPKSFNEKLVNPYIAPLMADEEMLIGLPRAYVMTAGYDIIRDDGIMYAERLKKANVPVHLNNHATASHITLFSSTGTFLSLTLAKQMMQDIVNLLQLHL